MTGRRMWRAAAVAVVAVLALGGGSAGADGRGGDDRDGRDGFDARPVTTGPNYDRNPSVVEDGSRTYLFFARSQVPCNRLAGCDADNTDYDLYVKVSLNGGRTYGPDQLVAPNPGPSGLFRGRTIAATRRSNGQMVVFWASGANANAPLYVLEETTQGVFTAPTPMPQFVPGVNGAFNIDAVAKGNAVHLYTEECCAAPGVWAQLYVSPAAVTGRTLVSADKNLPKVIVDRSGRFRLTYADASDYPTVEAYVNSSTDGLVFTQEVLAVREEGVSHWDPNLLQEGGLWYLFTAPDDLSGRQQIAVAVSRNFTSWTRPVRITPGEQNGVRYWDYWPEPFGARDQLYFTSERGVAGGPPGTGHIWRISAG